MRAKILPMRSHNQVSSTAKIPANAKASIDIVKPSLIMAKPWMNVNIVADMMVPTGHAEKDHRHSVQRHGF